MSSYNKEYSEELGLSEEPIEHLKCAKQMYPQSNSDTDKIHTIPYLDELLSDKDFYEFLDTLYYYVEGLHGMTASDVCSEIYTERDKETQTVHNNGVIFK